MKIEDLTPEQLERLTPKVKDFFALRGFLVSESQEREAVESFLMFIEPLVPVVEHPLKELSEILARLQEEQKAVQIKQPKLSNEPFYSKFYRRRNK